MKYEWHTARLDDVDNILQLAEDSFMKEIAGIFTPHHAVYQRNLAYAIMNQYYFTGSEMLAVAKTTDTNTLIAYNWAKSGDCAWWSDDRMINVRMAHVNMDLPARTRIRLIKDMMGQWERLAHYTRNPIICSTTMRHDQDTFLRLHEQAGYSVRGSYAYKRIELSTT